MDGGFLQPDAENQKGQMKKFIILWTVLMAVSYTHLDVYKRQA